MLSYEVRLSEQQTLRARGVCSQMPHIVAIAVIFYLPVHDAPNKSTSILTFRLTDVKPPKEEEAWSLALRECPHRSDPLFESPELHVQLVERGEQRAERSSGRHLRECVHVLGEALAAVAEFAVRPRNARVHLVDVA